MTDLLFIIVMSSASETSLREALDGEAGAWTRRALSRPAADALRAGIPRKLGMTSFGEATRSPCKCLMPFLHPTQPFHGIPAGGPYTEASRSIAADIVRLANQPEWPT